MTSESNASVAEQNHEAEVRGRELTLSYGGVRLRFVAGDDRTILRSRHPQSSFLVQTTEAADCTITCVNESVADWNAPPLSDPDDVREERIDEATGETHVFFYGIRRTREMTPYLVLQISPDFDRVRAIHEPTDENDPVFSIGFPVDEYLAIRLLARRQAVVLHACALEHDGQAIVFSGHSGAGKSTIAELGEVGAGATVLSDDRTILTVRDGVLLAWGTPWHGSYKRGNPAGAPVRGIFLLVQANEDRVTPFSPLRAFQELFVRVIQPSQDLVELQANVATLEQAVALAPAAELRFRPTSAAYELARAFRAH